VGSVVGKLREGWRRRSALGAVLVCSCALIAGCGDDQSTGDGGGDPFTVDEVSAIEVEEESSPTASEPKPADVDSLEPLRAADQDEALPSIRGLSGPGVEEWLNELDYRIVRYWQQVFANADLRYRVPKQLIFTSGRVPVPACRTTASQGSGPFYCPRNMTFYLPVAWFERRAEQSSDAAVAAVVAHENGHHLQNLLGLFSRRAGLITIQYELQADCFAGIFMSSLVPRGELEPDDIGEALASLAAAGDAPGTSVRDPTAHGSAELRRASFLDGFENPQTACAPPPVPPGE
jgi:hypothetical protein